MKACRHATADNFDTTNTSLSTREKVKSLGNNSIADAAGHRETTEEKFERRLRYRVSWGDSRCLPITSFHITLCLYQITAPKLLEHVSIGFVPPPLPPRALHPLTPHSTAAPYLLGPALAVRGQGKQEESIIFFVLVSVELRFFFLSAQIAWPNELNDSELKSESHQAWSLVTLFTWCLLRTSNTKFLTNWLKKLRNLTSNLWDLNAGESHTVRACRANHY